MTKTIRPISIDTIFDAPNAQDLFTAYADEARGHLLPHAANPDHKTYLAMEQAGLTDSFGVYDNTELVGFLVQFTSVMPHYTELSTTIDAQFILKAHRSGGVAQRLIAMASLVASERGSTTMFMSALNGSALDKVAPRFGFTATNTVYTKALG